MILEFYMTFKGKKYGKTGLIFLSFLKYKFTIPVSFIPNFLYIKLMYYIFFLL